MLGRNLQRDGEDIYATGCLNITKEDGCVMHELAIAQGILDISVDTAIKNQASRVIGVRVLAGELTGIVPEALAFGFDALAESTIAAGAKLSVVMVPLTGKCLDCTVEGLIDRYRFSCPECGSYAIEVRSGRELKVESVEVE